MNYTTYHLHTEQSLLDSCTNYKLYVDKAKELGQKAICFTEHGNIYCWYEKKMYCDANDIKYIHGVECYLTEDKIGDDKHRDNYHTILIAKNHDGFVELNNLIFMSTHKDHVYYKPRITFDEFLNISDNIIKISACLASPLNRLRETYPQLLQHYDYYEIQYHDCDEQIEYNKWLYKMSKKYNKPLIVGTDTHSLNKYKAECRSILQLGKEIEFSNEDEFDLTYKSYDELVEMFVKQQSLPMDVVLEAINNTNVMADSCEPIEIDTSVKYPILYGESDEEVMWETLRKKYKEKRKSGIITNDMQYVDNIKEEMRVFKKVNMVGFMLFMSEMISWCKENNIPTSPCRGSVGGSTVAFISDIIDVDPIVWKTVFSRFCNEDREEVGDIDCDFYEEDRPKVYDYIINRFGKEKTAYILASGTCVDKSTIDIIGKALRKRYQRQGIYDKYTISEVGEIKDLFGVDPDAAKEKYKELFYYFDGLCNTVISQSQHPAGIVASPINLIDNYSVFIGSDGQYILPINMEEVHEIGLVKYDILGLKNIGIIKKCCEYANIPYPKSHEINWNDQNVYEDMLRSPIGIFQFEGNYAFELLKRFGVHTINDMSLVNASLRPSGESYRDRLIAHEPNKNPSEIIDKLLEPNHGYLVFQEDVIAFLQQICGLSGSEADNVRRAIGRKQMDRLQKALPSIFEGYCNKSDKSREVAEEEARVFLKIIEDASSYMFGYNHSTGYSMLGYLCAYMRYYYPKEFCCAFLNCAKSEEDIRNGTMLCHEYGIEIARPLFGESLNEFRCEDGANTIYKGLRSIKDIGKNTGDELYSIRDNKHDTFFDLLADIKQNTSVNSKQLDILIKLNFFEMFGNPNELLAYVDVYNQYANKKQLSKDKISPEDLPYVIKYSNKATAKQFREIDTKSLITDICNDINIMTSVEQLAQYQALLLGYCDVQDVGNPHCIVTNVETTSFGTPYVTLYSLNSQNTKTFKADKKFFGQFKLEVGDVIKISLRNKPKRKKVDDKWVSDGDETILTAWVRK